MRPEKQPEPKRVEFKMSASCKNSQACKDLGKHTKQQNQETRSRNQPGNATGTRVFLLPKTQDFPCSPSGCTHVLITAVLSAQNTMGYFSPCSDQSHNRVPARQTPTSVEKGEGRGPCQCCLSVAHSTAPTPPLKQILSFSISTYGQCCLLPTVKCFHFTGNVEETARDNHERPKQNSQDY